MAAWFIFIGFPRGSAEVYFMEAILVIAGEDIDLCIVDKQHVLVGMNGRMVAKHSVVLTEVVTKFNISANFQLKRNYISWLVALFLTNSTLFLNICATLLQMWLAVFALHLWLPIVFHSWLAKI